MSENTPVYSVAIPVDILKDQTISASAKLLYGIIDSFQKKSSVCYASNERLAEELGGCTARTASKCIGELKDAGYILIENGKTRKIYLKVYAYGGQEGGRKLPPCEDKVSTRVEETFQGGGRNFPPSNTESVNKKENKKRKAEKPQPLTDEQLHDAVVAEIVNLADESWTKTQKNEIYRLTMALYDPNRVVQKSHPVRSYLSVSGTFSKLSQAGNPAAMIDMLNTAIIGGWQGVRVPDNPKQTKSTTEERRYQCV